MKIEIDIDIESIVKEALKKKQEEDIAPIETIDIITNTKSKWEYGRSPGKRRTTEELELHRLEKEKGDLLTPEEKGEARARIQLDETAENNAKEAAIKKARIETIAAEGMAAASKELQEEASQEKQEEEEIPKAEPINTPNSLFS